MTRRIKRFSDFELNLLIKNEEFIRPPRDSQRNWLLNRAMSEFAHDIYALDRHAQSFVAGSDQLATGDRTQAVLSDMEIMEDWQEPIMRAMARAATGGRGDLLEIGFGRGVASSMIQDFGVDSHTIIECNDSIVERFEQWRAAYPDREITMVHGMWQDRLPDLGAFDTIFFHTYPLNETDFVEQIAGSVTFAAHFFESAAAHLRMGGVFTYLSNEIDSLSRQHQRELFRHFSNIELSVVSGLDLPQQVQDQWWADSMVIVKAVK